MPWHLYLEELKFRGERSVDLRPGVVLKSWEGVVTFSGASSAGAMDERLFV
jgi:hypothetical protein